MLRVEEVGDTAETSDCTVTSPCRSNLLISAIPGIMALCMCVRVCVCVCVCVKKGGRGCWIARYVDSGWRDGRWMNRMKGIRETGRNNGKKGSEVPAPLGFRAVGVEVEGNTSTFGGPSVPTKIML